MQTNMGTADRIIRLALALLFAALFFTGSVIGVAGGILLVLAVVLALTSLVSHCPVYRIFGIRTCPRDG